MLPTYTIRKIFGYLPRFFVFAIRTFPLVRVVLGLTLLMVVLEYATLSLMIPLVQGGIGSTAKPGVLGRFWDHTAAILGLQSSPRTWLWLFLVFFALRIVVGYTQITLNIFTAKQIHAYLSDKVMRRVVIHEPLANIYSAPSDFTRRSPGTKPARRETSSLRWVSCSPRRSRRWPVSRCC